MNNIKTKRGRKWLITINNPTIEFEEIKNIIEKKYKTTIYYCYCEEIGNETHTRHYHIFIYFKNAVTGSSLLKTFEGCHLDFCNGTCQENRDYIYKCGKYEGSEKEDTRQEGMQFESGECPKEEKGKRNDLEELRDMILQGKSNADIYNENAQYMRFSGNIDRVRNDLLTDKYKNEWRDLEFTYIFGKTGKGKTRGVMEEYGYTNVYRITDYDHAWDNYNNQDVVSFEEFRSSLKIQDMLNYGDGYPLTLPSRYSNKVACYRKIFITTNIPLEEQYISVQEEHPETWQAFLRRIHKVIIREKDFDKVFYQKNRGTEEEPQYDFVSADGVSYFDPFGLKEWGETDNDFWHTLDDFDGNDLFDTPQEKEEVKETKQVEIGKSVLGHIYTTDCEYYYQYPCADIEKPKFIYKKCVVPPHLNEYECKENIKEFEKIHRLLEAQKAKEEKEKKEKEEKLLKEFENITEDEY